MKVEKSEMRRAYTEITEDAEFTEFTETKREPERDSSHKRRAMQNHPSLLGPTGQRSARKKKSGHSVRNDVVGDFGRVREKRGLGFGYKDSAWRT